MRRSARIGVGCVESHLRNHGSIKMKSITPFLWLESGAADAAEFYLEVFDDAEVTSTMPGEGGEPLGVTVRVKNLAFTLFNGGPHFKLDEAFSLMIITDTQEETDRLWSDLTADGGKPSRCGWLKDKFGVIWQVVPEGFMQCVFGSDPDGSKRAYDAMMKMNKLVLADIQAAYEGR